MLRVPDRAMREPAEVEITTELAIDPDEKIQVERGGHAQRVVVGRQQLALVLHEIGADQQDILLEERRSNAAQKRAGSRRIEVADVRSEKQGQRPPAHARAGRDL